MDYDLLTFNIRLFQMSSDMGVLCAKGIQIKEIQDKENLAIPNSLVKTVSPTPIEEKQSLNWVAEMLAKNYLQYDIERDIAQYVWSSLLDKVKVKNCKIDTISALYELSKMCQGISKEDDFRYEELNKELPLAASIIKNPELAKAEFSKKPYLDEVCVRIQDTAERCLFHIAEYYCDQKKLQLLFEKESQNQSVKDQWNFSQIIKPRYFTCVPFFEFQELIPGVKIKKREDAESNSGNNCAFYAFGSEPWYALRSDQDDEDIHFDTLSFLSKKGWAQITLKSAQSGDKVIYFDKNPFDKSGQVDKPAEVFAVHFGIIDRVRDDKIRVISKFGGGYLFRHPLEITYLESPYVVCIRKTNDLTCTFLELDHNH